MRRLAAVDPRRRAELNSDRSTPPSTPVRHRCPERRTDDTARPTADPAGRLHPGRAAGRDRDPRPPDRPARCRRSTAPIGTAKNAAVSAEINQLAQALAAFKSKYGDYPPSRILLAENGYYITTATTSTGRLVMRRGTQSTSPTQQLAQRSLTAMRKFFPRVDFHAARWPRPFPPDPRARRTSGTTSTATASSTTPAYSSRAHECLVFFLGGIPQTAGRRHGHLRR